MTKRLKRAIGLGIGVATFFISRDLFFGENQSSIGILKTIIAAVLTGLILAFLLWLIFPKWYEPKSTTDDN